eukprot:GEMP01082633.1.p1 GENE.GEMP01082633.1~~GEMP01082633.1.p1  ORF type:complete len:215 (+),score=29.99 GEMP01082633.1:56-700(+)
MEWTTWVGPFMRFRKVNIGFSDPFIYRSSAPHFYTVLDQDGSVMLSPKDANALTSDADIGAILSLISVDIPNANKIFADVGIEAYKHLPVSDFEAISLTHIEAGIKYIEEQRRLGRRTLIYCGYGSGRTGTLLAAYEVLLMLRNNLDISLEQVENYVNTRNKMIKRRSSMSYTSTHDIETPAQLRRILEFARMQHAKSKWDPFFEIEREDTCCC